MPKKTKATKITDSNKAWNKKSKSSSYRIETIQINKTILIVCEGQTEELYFQSFPVLGMKVTAINLGGQSKLKLVEKTKEIIKNSDEEYDETWCVFDMDVKHGETEYSDFDNSINKAKQLGYKVAYSNDSFELWFYLHYNYIEAQNLRGFYYQELSKVFGISYEKDGKKYDFCLNLYKTLIENTSSSQDSAIERAKKLYEKFKHLPYHKQNPLTTVFKLVVELNKNLRK
jgi:hypothetical protein